MLLSVNDNKLFCKKLWIFRACCVGGLGGAGAWGGRVRVDNVQMYM